jgi:hypothetical protein
MLVMTPYLEMSSSQPLGTPIVLIEPRASDTGFLPLGSGFTSPGSSERRLAPSVAGAGTGLFGGQITLSQTSPSAPATSSEPRNGAAHHGFAERLNDWIASLPQTQTVPLSAMDRDELYR